MPLCEQAGYCEKAVGGPVTGETRRTGMQGRDLSREFAEAQFWSERGLFVLAALSLRMGVKWRLEAIVQRARDAGVGADGESVGVLAAKIDEAENAAVTRWMKTRWQPTPPEWFRRIAIAVVLVPPDLTALPPSLVSVPAFHHPDIDRSVQDRVAARRTLNAAFTAHLDAYLDATYAELEGKARVFRHYEWTARFQFVPESHATIAKAANVKEEAVRLAVNGVAQAIGLSLRTEKRETRMKPGPKPKRDTQVDA